MQIEINGIERDIGEVKVVQVCGREIIMESHDGMRRFCVETYEEAKRIFTEIKREIERVEGWHQN